MKKLLIASNVFFLGLSIWFYYQANFTGNKQSQFATAYAGTLGVKSFVSLNQVNTSCVECKDYSNDPFEGLPAGLAATMISNYTNNYWQNHRSPNYYSPNANPNNPNSLQGPDARSIWFSLDTLKKFIWHIEDEVCKNNCVDKTTLGIRIYYGQYPDLNGWSVYDQTPSHYNKKVAYQKLHSAFMVPTYFKGTNNIDFDPRFISNNGTCSAMSMPQVMAILGVSVAINNDTSRTTTVTSSSPMNNAFVLAPNLRPFVRNDGSLIPPPPPSSVAGTTFPLSMRGGSGYGAGFIDFIDGNSSITY